MCRLMVLFAVLAALTLVAFDAGACSFAGPESHVVDTNSDDKTPPLALKAPGVTVTRGRGPESEGCNESTTSCDDIGTISLHVVAPDDDRTPAERMGFVIELIGGTLPNGMSIVSPVRASAQAISFRWTDGATDDQEPIDFTLSIRAMDEAGNVGEPVSVPIRHAGDDAGCRVSARSVSGSWLPTFALTLLMLAAAHAVARRRSSRRIRSIEQ